ncbi:small ribosomal subunit protein uS11m isoform X3 [Pongo pygmaeus]|uniref:small ribosomal subunit protein uS11m isoform X3 n=1 Tax=Pongo pygmaeus TaxID=9600 RepID=UPI0004F4A103|nr:28S ribosomal protein S11, mitochondrial isoform X3 [Pongo abelii]XP_054307311.1 28S ribosomal protein S11, mitochondrial isoform X4 [Pongo pygmaeus]
MQAVRNVGSWFLRSWTWTQTTGRVVARTPAGTIHTGARQLQDAAAKQKVEVKAAPSHTKFSIYPPIPGEENSLRWAGKKFEEIPIAHIKASHNNTLIQVVSASNEPLALASCGTEGFRNAKKGTGVAAQTAGIAAAAHRPYKCSDSAKPDVFPEGQP